TRAPRKAHYRPAKDRAGAPTDPPGSVDPLQLGPGGGCGFGGEAGAEPVAEERVHGPHPQPAGIAGLLDVVVVLEKPGELGGGEVGVEGEAAELLDLVLAIRELVE